MSIVAKIVRVFFLNTSDLFKFCPKEFDFWKIFTLTPLKMGIFSTVKHQTSCSFDPSCSTMTKIHSYNTSILYLPWQWPRIWIMTLNCTTFFNSPIYQRIPSLCIPFFPKNDLLAPWYYEEDYFRLKKNVTCCKRPIFLIYICYILLCLYSDSISEEILKTTTISKEDLDKYMYSWRKDDEMSYIAK